MSELERHNDSGEAIGSLHKMSTTAGVSSSDYVAINTLAIFAAVFGAVTALAVPWTLFLPLGLAAVACGLLALRQIRNSNGTQGGRGIAYLGIALAIVLAGAAVAMAVSREAALSKDKRAINGAIERLRQAVLAGDYAKAYDLFDPAFQQAMGRSEFDRRWQYQMDPTNGGGRLTQFVGNDIFEFSTSSGERVAFTKAIIRFERSPEAGRAGIEFRQMGDGQWRIRRIADMFDPRPAKGKGK